MKTITFNMKTIKVFLWLNIWIPFLSSMFCLIEVNSLKIMNKYMFTSARKLTCQRTPNWVILISRGTVIVWSYYIHHWQWAESTQLTRKYINGNINVIYVCGAETQIVMFSTKFYSVGLILFTPLWSMTRLYEYNKQKGQRFPLQMLKNFIIFCFHSKTAYLHWLTCILKRK